MVRSLDTKSELGVSSREPPPGGGDVQQGIESSVGGILIGGVEGASGATAAAAVEACGTTSRTATPGSSLAEEDELLMASQGNSLTGTAASMKGHNGSGDGAWVKARSSMPRNFRLSLDGYTLQTDQDGTYAAYKISVTAGLHTWLVHRRYRQFLALHTAICEHVKPEDTPPLPGKRILGSSVDPSFAEARGLALQVYLRQLVCVSAAWKVPQLIGFLDERASMMGVQTQIGDVLDQMDRMGSLCVDLQHQLSLSQMQVQRQNELVETLCSQLKKMEQDYAALSAQAEASAATATAEVEKGDVEDTEVTGLEGASSGEQEEETGETGAEAEGTGRRAAARAMVGSGVVTPARMRAATVPTLSAAGCSTTPGEQPTYGFGSGPGMMRRMSSISITGGIAGSAGFGGSSVPTASIDMSDLNNLVKRVESANQLSMKVSSDDEDDAVDQLLEHQHQMIMRSSSAYSLASNPDAGAQGSKGLLVEGEAHETAVADKANPADDDGNLNDSGRSIGRVPRPRNAALPITIPVPEGSRPPKVWERLQKGGSLLGDPEERMMAEGQYGNTPGSGLVKDVSRSMFGLSSPPCAPPTAPRWTSSVSAMLGLGGGGGIGNNGGTGGSVAPGGGGGGGAEGDVWGRPGTGADGAGGPSGGGFAEADDDPLPLDILPSNKEPLAIDRRVDDLLRLLRPAPRAEGYRRSVFQFVMRQVKRALGAQCFPVGGYAIQAYLPDEEVGISAFLCHGQEKSWFVRVNETLCKVSSEASEKAEAEGERDSGDGVGASVGDEVGGGGEGGIANGGSTSAGAPSGSKEAGEGSSYRHRLSNVNFINMGRIQKIKCVVDNQVAVDIGANQVGDIATVALLEETDQLLGKNHLFKRSLLLIKSWWVYESRAYTGSNMLSRITEAALATMVLAVVNQHHARLHTPLQVMSVFFQMHSQFDWSRYCWCIEGARRLDTLHSNSSPESFSASLESDSSAEPLLLSQEILNRYRLRQGGRARHRGTTQRHQQGGGRKSPVGGAGAGAGGGTQSNVEQGESLPGTGGVGSGGHVVAGGVGTGVVPDSGKEEGGVGSAAGVPAATANGGGGGGGEKKKLFPIRNMNVMNPLDSNDNQIDDTVNRRRAARMHSLLQMGARQLRPVLMHLKREVTKAQRGQPDPPHPGHLHTTSVAMLETFFTLSWARFGQGWRPDVPPHLDRDHEKIPWSTYDHDYNFFASAAAGVGRDGASLTDEERLGREAAKVAGGGAAAAGEKALVAAVASRMTGGKHRDPFHVDLQSVRDSVKYCCFLLEAEVTDSALLALSKEILSGKGSLPVGEIGKLLQEATANASLSATLKDQFGGLKKFLEKYPGEFVIASDHPFNPHVYLKSTLTAEELDTVMRGGTVVQTGTGGGACGVGGGGGSGGGGAKKHKSKSSKRRPSTNKQQNQQGQQHHHLQHQGAGSGMLHQQPPPPPPQQKNEGHLRVGHPVISQQRDDQAQQQIRAQNEQLYRHHHHQQQHEAMLGITRVHHEGSGGSSVLSHTQQQQKQQQQQGIPRQGTGRSGGVSGLPRSQVPNHHHQQQQQQQIPPSQLPQHVRSGFSAAAAPPRISRPSASQQPQLSPTPGQHHEQSARRRQQQQRQEDSLSGMFVPQATDGLGGTVDLYRGDSVKPQRLGGRVGEGLGHIGVGVVGGVQDFDSRGSRIGSDQSYDLMGSRLSPDHLHHHQQQQQQQQQQQLLPGLTGALAQQQRQQQQQQQKRLQREVGDLGGNGSAVRRNELRANGRNDPWGNESFTALGNGLSAGQQQQSQQDQSDLLLQGSAALSSMVGIDSELGDFGRGEGETFFFKTHQQQRQQQEHQRQQLLQQQQMHQGISRFGSGLDGLLGAAPQRDDSPFFD